MIVALDYLQSDPKTGVIYYRRKFPQDLVPFIPSSSPAHRGRVEMKTSLRVKNMREPSASGKYATAQSTFDRIVIEATMAKAAAEKRASGAFDRLTHRQIENLATMLVSDRRIGAGQRVREGQVQVLQMHLEDAGKALVEARLAGENSGKLETIFGDTADEFLAAQGISLAPDVR